MTPVACSIFSVSRLRIFQAQKIDSAKTASETTPTPMTLPYAISSSAPWPCVIVVRLVVSAHGCLYRSDSGR